MRGSFKKILGLCQGWATGSGDTGIRPPISLSIDFYSRFTREYELIGAFVA